MKPRKSSLLLAAGAVVLMQLPAQARVQLEDTVNVNADMSTVWQALKDYQKEGKLFDKRITKETGNDTSINEDFIKLPIVGTTTLDYVESRKGNDRVDYWLTGSKILNVFKGSWQLSKNENGGTTIKLTTDIDSWMPVPLKNKILRNNTMPGMKKRLYYVKTHAEELAGHKVSSQGADSQKNL